MPFEWSHVGCEVEVMYYQRLKSANHAYEDGVIDIGIGRSTLQERHLTKRITMKDNKDNVFLVVQT